jgi:hypothetical protein
VFVKSVSQSARQCVLHLYACKQEVVSSKTTNMSWTSPGKRIEKRKKETMALIEAEVE